MRILALFPTLSTYSYSLPSRTPQFSSRPSSSISSNKSNTNYILLVPKRRIFRETPKLNLIPNSSFAPDPFQFHSPPRRILSQAKEDEKARNCHFPPPRPFRDHVLESLFCHFIQHTLSGYTPSLIFTIRRLDLLIRPTSRRRVFFCFRHCSLSAHLHPFFESERVRSTTQQQQQQQSSQRAAPWSAALRHRYMISLTALFEYSSPRKSTTPTPDPDSSSCHPGFYDKPPFPYVNLADNHLVGCMLDYDRQDLILAYAISDSESDGRT